MTIEKALNRLAWWVTPQKDQVGNVFFKNIKPNRTDLESVNFMIEWVKEQKHKTIQQNELFAKLYIYTYHQFLAYYGGSIFDSIPQKELNKLVSAPLESFYAAFKQKLEDNAIYEIIDAKNALCEADVKRDKFPIEDVISNLNNMITEAINRYGSAR